MRLSRRKFAIGSAAAAAGILPDWAAGQTLPAAHYRGPNVVIVRFGGGVRRHETIEIATTYAPFLAHRLVPRDVLLPAMTIAQLTGVETSHAEGTLNILTGRYRGYEDVSPLPVLHRLRPTVPTLFQTLRLAFGVAPHEALMINGESRQEEEFLMRSGHSHTGFEHEGEIISLYRFKLHKLGRILSERTEKPEALAAAEKQLASLLRRDALGRKTPVPQAPAIVAMWDRWRERFGDSGLVNARGDRLLTQLALTAFAELKPRLMMICYQDPDYVHWGNATHYTRAIAIIDDGLRQIVDMLDHDPFYRGNTILCVVPDCGRDANPLMNVPFQHHFGSRAAHQIWALFTGPGIGRDRRDSAPVDQSGIAPTLAQLMGLHMPAAEGGLLSTVFA